MTSYKIGITLVLAILLSSTLFAQSSDIDVLHLKNGSIIRGTIIEQVIGETVKIETADHSIFVFKYDEIEKITREESEESGKNNASNQSAETALTDNPASITTLGKYTDVRRLTLMGGIWSISEGGTEESVFSFALVANRFINDYFTFGLGAGYVSCPNGFFLPIYLDLHLYLQPQQITPFLYGKFGYSFAGIKDIDGLNYGGLMANFGGGIDIRGESGIGLMLEVGYKFQKAKCAYYNPYSGEVFSTIDHDLKGLTVNVGINITFFIPK